MNASVNDSNVLPHTEPGQWHGRPAGANEITPAGRLCHPADPARCPLCGGVNDCRLCTAAAYKGSCWCAKVSIPDELQARVPVGDRNRACICRQCVTAFHAAQGAAGSARTTTEDYYFDASGLMVFTEAYHLRRGTCCDSGCRHCPFERVP